MITSMMGLLSEFMIPLTFIAHITVFVGGFYIALHNRTIPTWLTTLLWYIGLSSFFVALTILIMWMVGPSSNLAYNAIGIYGELISRIMLAITVFAMFANTVFNDIKGVKKRRQREEIAGGS